MYRITVEIDGYKIEFNSNLIPPGSPKEIKEWINKELGKKAKIIFRQITANERILWSI